MKTNEYIKSTKVDKVNKLNKLNKGTKVNKGTNKPNHKPKPKPIEMTELILYNALSTTPFNIYHGTAPSNKKLPYVIYNKTTQTIEYSLQGNLSIQNSRFQVDIYSKTYSECKEIEKEVRIAIENITDAQQIIYSIDDFIQNDENRIKIDLKLWKK